MDLLSINLFQFESNPTPDVIVIGLQEIVALNPKNVMVTNHSHETQISIWTQVFIQNLKNIDNYVSIKKQGMVGIATFIFVKNSLKHRISKIQHDLIKTGIGSLKLG